MTLAVHKCCCSSIPCSSPVLSWRGATCSIRGSSTISSNHLHEVGSSERWTNLAMHERCTFFVKRGSKRQRVYEMYVCNVLIRDKSHHSDDAHLVKAKVGFSVMTFLWRYNDVDLESETMWYVCTSTWEWVASTSCCPLILPACKRVNFVRQQSLTFWDSDSSRNTITISVFKRI